MKNENNTIRNEQIVEMWMSEIGDSEELVRRTLDYIPDELRIIKYADDGTPVAICMAVPLSVDIWGAKLNLAYVQAAQVVLSHRGTAIDRELFKEMLHANYQFGCHLMTAVTLDPRLVPYYERLFMCSECMGNRLESCSKEEVVQTRGYTIEPIFDNLFETIAALCADIPHCVLPNPKMFAATKHSIEYYVAKNKDNEVVGIVGIDADVLPRLHLLEASNEDARQALLHFVFQHCNTLESIVYAVPSAEPVLKSGYIARIIDASAVLVHYAAAHPEVECTYTITDSSIAENNRSFRLSHGTCVTVDTPAADAHAVSIRELAREILPAIYLPTMFY